MSSCQDAPDATQGDKQHVLLDGDVCRLVEPQGGIKAPQVPGLQLVSPQQVSPLDGGSPLAALRVYLQHLQAV